MQFEREALKRLKMWMKGKRAPPLRIDLEPTASCNLKCLFCWTRSKERVKNCRYEKHLTNKRLLEIVDEAAELDVKQWEIAGGWEPMANPKVTFKVMVSIKKHGMFGSITTNGTLFTNRMVKRLVEVGWDRILFSLEGPDAKTHDYLTQTKGAFEKETRNIRLFKKWKEKLGKDKPRYSIHAVLTNKNYDKLEEMVKLGKELGAEGVNFEPLIIWSKAGEKLRLTEKQKKELDVHIERALKVAEELGIYTNVANLRRKELVIKKDMRRVMKRHVSCDGKSILSSPCFSPWLNMEIRFSGRVTYCRLCNDETGTDNIMDKSLEDIWFGEYFENARKNFVKCRLPEFCKDCASGVIVEMQNLREKLINSKNPLKWIKGAM